MHIKVKDLPPKVQHALLAVSYKRGDIKAIKAEVASMFYPGGNGKRGFYITVNETYKIYWGSWGGANPFSALPVDRDHTEFPIDEYIIKGSYGTTTFAQIYSPLFLDIPQKSVTQRQQKILQAYKYKSKYKLKLLNEMRISKMEITRLINMGYIKKQGSGTAITTEGKNVLD